MKKVFFILFFATLLYGCGGGDSKSTTNTTSESSQPMADNDESADKPAYDPKRGEGKFTAENLPVGSAVDQTMASQGEKIQGVKCSSCHKLSNEKLVGPGWKGVTERRKPEWIMNFMKRKPCLSFAW